MLNPCYCRSRDEFDFSFSNLTLWSKAFAFPLQMIILTVCLSSPTLYLGCLSLAFSNNWLLQMCTSVFCWSLTSERYCIFYWGLFVHERYFLHDLQAVYLVIEIILRCFCLWKTVTDCLANVSSCQHVDLCASIHTGNNISFSQMLL